MNTFWTPELVHRVYRVSGRVACQGCDHVVRDVDNDDPIYEIEAAREVDGKHVVVPDLREHLCPECASSCSYCWQRPAAVSALNAGRYQDRVCIECFQDHWSGPEIAKAPGRVELPHAEGWL